MEVLTLLRDAAAAGLRIALDGDRLRVRGPGSAKVVAQRLGDHREAVLEALALYAERAAIIEHEGGMHREEAEAQARTAVPRILSTMGEMASSNCHCRGEHP